MPVMVTSPLNVAAPDVRASIERLENTCVTVAPVPPPLNFNTTSLPLAISKSFEAL